MDSGTAFFEQVALWSEVAGAAAFLLVVIVMFRKFLVPAVVANQQARNAELAEAESRRARMQAEAANARAEVEMAERDAVEIRSRIATIAAHDRDRQLAEAKADGERVVRNAEGELERARFAARDRLRVEFIEKALAKARADAPARVDDATNQKLVETTVADLVRGKT